MKSKAIDTKKILFIIKLIMVIALILVLAIFVFVPSAESLGYYSKYFRSYNSAKAFSQVENTYNLDKDSVVYSYDKANEVIVYSRDVYNIANTGESDKYIKMFALGNFSQRYTEFAFTGIVSIKGDYAIVTRPFNLVNGVTGEVTLIERIGVIKFRGGDKKDVTSFNNENVEYNANYQQVAFLGDDYIICVGISLIPSHIFNFSTIYRYKEKNELLEVCKIKEIDYEYSVSMYDDYIVAIGEQKGYAYFFDINNVDSVTGYLPCLSYDVYKGWPQDTEDAFVENTEIFVSYLGNGWFSRTATIKAKDIFEGCNIAFQEVDSNTGVATTIYARIRSDFYNVRTKSTRTNDWLYINSIINEFNADTYTGIVNGLNNNILADKTYEGRYEYNLPFLNPAAFITKGYSLAYFYYFPYPDRPLIYEVSFCLVDKNANVIKLSDMLMPPLFIDGIGIQSSDPTFESVMGNFKYVTMNNSFVILEEYINKINSYETIISHDNIIIGKEWNFKKNTALYGACDRNGTQIVPFEYYELTIFYEGTALGTKPNDDKKLDYFRISSEGSVTKITDNIVSIRQGVYVAESNKKVGLYTYEGLTLLPAEYDTVDVFDTFTYGDEFQSTFAVAYKGSYGYIYKLK